MILINSIYRNTKSPHTVQACGDLIVFFEDAAASPDSHPQMAVTCSRSGMERMAPFLVVTR